MNHLKFAWLALIALGLSACPAPNPSTLPSPDLSLEPFSNPSGLAQTISSLTDRRLAYSMLLKKGLIRVGMPIPENADFTLETVDDPYRFASAKELSLFRRPMPTTNLNFLSTLMWDGRESPKNQTMHANLAHQSNSVTRGDAEGTRDLTLLEREQIVQFELQLHSAQSFDFAAGDLITCETSDRPRSHSSSCRVRAQALTPSGTNRTSRRAIGTERGVMNQARDRTGGG